MCFTSGTVTLIHLLFLENKKRVMSYITPEEAMSRIERVLHEEYDLLHPNRETARAALDSIVSILDEVEPRKSTGGKAPKKIVPPRH